MSTYSKIVDRQRTWATEKRGLDLVGSQGERGLKTYTPSIRDNLFEDLEPETIANFKQGDGNEIQDTPAKMRAAHSTSALAVNIFQYWQRRSVSTIAAACGFCDAKDCKSHKIVFEEKFPIPNVIGRPPNIDVVIHNNSSVKLFAIECKFTEAYRPDKLKGLNPKYLEVDDIWRGLPELHKLAREITPVDEKYSYLDRAQLIRHILGLKHSRSDFKLLYLWYDDSDGDGAPHEQEINKFQEIVSKDGISFHHLTYQKLIGQLTKFRAGNESYIDYIRDRYL